MSVSRHVLHGRRHSGERVAQGQGCLPSATRDGAGLLQCCSFCLDAARTQVSPDPDRWSQAGLAALLGYLTVPTHRSQHSPPESTAVYVLGSRSDDTASSSRTDPFSLHPQWAPRARLHHSTSSVSGPEQTASAQQSHACTSSLVKLKCCKVHCILVFPVRPRLRGHLGGLRDRCWGRVPGNRCPVWGASGRNNHHCSQWAGDRGTPGHQARSPYRWAPPAPWRPLWERQREP